MEAAAQNPQSTREGRIEISGLRHVYKGGTVALDGVDLSFGTGLFGLLGPNGAGKSTLMRILCTLLVPTAGQVRVDGYDVVAERDAVRASLGYLPQEFGAWRLQRVEEALDTLALLAGITSRGERHERIGRVLEEVGLAKVSDRKVKKLSGGMLRRLGVAQALIHDPKIIVVDEPTVGLDPEERLRFRKVMADLSQDRTIVLSTHIVSDLGSSCSDLAIIDAGKIEFRGSPADLTEQARGRVFEVDLEPGTNPAGGGYEIVATTRVEGKIRMRAVATTGTLPAGASEVDKPTLEEAYLAFMAARGRADAAISRNLGGEETS
ncbi:MAG: ATP-binding cassette domain-containing protein [Acidobacteria bacterium]|nr:ATP-binding cassette domain-containing protein [Acidobacteriota bacterium]NIM61872.1 ATP-binding cassette domain-containing protein [Acidobacteriota bacterium]NIO60829.1 ATP-binding cassette domain-containing protein [Acidobacteriota bacterium]NIQ31904.1 ATP-binding cassette domain-containing protein [Acidobacteriota bacterium]NIQ87281.1 ATP-binding cassette domain-containing protein [Acidobacteriota bacterium]